MEVGQHLSREGSPTQEDMPPTNTETRDDQPDPLATPPPASPPPDEQELEMETGLGHMVDYPVNNVA